MKNILVGVGLWVCACVLLTASASAGQLTAKQKSWIVQRLKTASSPSALFQAIGWAGREGIKAAKPLIRKHLRSKDARVLQSAVIASGRLRDSKAAGRLMSLLSHSNKRVRVGAAWSLSRMRIKAAIPLLKRRLKRSHGFEQNTLLWTLTLYRSKALIPLYRKMMIRSGEKCQIVVASLRALKAFKGRTKCWSRAWRRTVKSRWKM